MDHKKRKSKEISCFEVLDVLFRRLKASPVAWASGGIGMSKWQFLTRKYNFFRCKIFLIFDHQNPGSGTGSGSAIITNDGSDPH
jgi:hypothetical protein